MTHLDDADTIPLWVSLGVAAVAGLSFLGVLLFLSRRRERPMKQAHAAAAMFIGVAIVIMDVALINRQASTVRDDGVDAVWGRWAFYVLVWAMFSWATSNVLSNQSNFVSITAIATSTLGAASLVIAAISSGNNVWLWYVLGGVLWVFSWLAYLFSYIRYGKVQKMFSFSRAIVLLATLALIYLIFYVFFGLGHAIANVVGLTLERWFYTGAEFLLFIFLAFVIAFQSNLIPKRLLGIGSNRTKSQANYRAPGM